MTHKNSILELILTDTCRRTSIVIGQILTDVQKKNVPCDDTYRSYHRYPRPMECFDLS